MLSMMSLTPPVSPSENLFPCEIGYQVDLGFGLSRCLNFAGTKVVRCVQYASRIKVNPNIAEVQRQKQNMLDLDFID